MTDPRNQSDWIWWRAETIIRDDYTCQNCGAKGGRKGETPLTAHHIEPVSDGGETNLANLKTLCTSCHYQAHGKETHENASRVTISLEDDVMERIDESVDGGNRSKWIREAVMERFIEEDNNEWVEPDKIQ